ncbi:Sec7 domain-containing protein [Baffinella frigidus]|nr:Sec7 domain-containing protein [Cryptophyta sp. CCMP2293]
MTSEEKAVAERFKDNPKKELKRLMAAGALADDPEAVSKFLLHSKGLDDAAMGDYVGDGDPFCKQVLTSYVGTFNFVGLGFDDSLRKFLSAFRLPGEAQKIERIMFSFSAQYFSHNPRSFRAADTAFKFAYSVIMLNTDAHNASIKANRKMTKAQFVHNNRGTP